MVHSFLSASLCKSVRERRTGFRTSLEFLTSASTARPEKFEQTELTVYSSTALSTAMTFTAPRSAGAVGINE